ncbi:MAG: 2,3,4,5-tetrahydropyridine-2,6-dicarboxylate N-succinyltransferase, partial [Gemmatimonadales bacterium]
MTDVTELRATVERYVAGVPAGEERSARAAVEQLKSHLNGGVVRAAERRPDGCWQANTWVKAGILLGFRL